MPICKKNIKKPQNEKLVFINQPISEAESDWIGVTSYVNKLEEAIHSGAQMIAIISGFGSGKSSLIGLLNKKLKCHPEKKYCFCRVNLWSHLESKNNSDHPPEIHKLLLYQLISKIDHKKSSYISKRLSKNYGLFKLTTISQGHAMIAYLAMIFVLLIATISFIMRFDITTQFFLDFQNKLGSLLFPLYIVTIVAISILLIKADMLFSSNRSEGKRQLEESEIVDLYKKLILKPRSYCICQPKTVPYFNRKLYQLGRTNRCFPSILWFLLSYKNHHSYLLHMTYELVCLSRQPLKPHH